MVDGDHKASCKICGKMSVRAVYDEVCWKCHLPIQGLKEEAEKAGGKWGLYEWEIIEGMEGIWSVGTASVNGGEFFINLMKWGNNYWIGLVSDYGKGVLEVGDSYCMPINFSRGDLDKGLDDLFERIIPPYEEFLKALEGDV